MATQAAGVEDLQVRDKIALECTELHPQARATRESTSKIQIERA
jgi:hypothetical protein